MVKLFFCFCALVNFKEKNNFPIVRHCVIIAIGHSFMNKVYKGPNFECHQDSMYGQQHIYSGTINLHIATPYCISHESGGYIPAIQDDQCYVTLVPEVLGVNQGCI